MQAAAITSRFLTGRSSKPGFADSESLVGNDDLLRAIVAGHLIQSVSSQELFLNLTNALVQFAEQPYLRRDLDPLEDVSRVLMNLPMDAARQIGTYYYALAINREGHTDEAVTLLQTSPITHRLLTGRERFKHWVEYITTWGSLMKHCGFSLRFCGSHRAKTRTVCRRC